MAVQPQWSLNQTSSSTIEIATGLMRAATTDNVQPLAILACELFGNTLAISPEALRKVEHSVLPTPKPAVLSFLQSSVGYSANDCASQLGKHTAGLQFLAFATALITTMGSFESGTIIHAMLASSAKDKTLLPTVRQIRDLTASIEPRCCRASLAEDVVGWQGLLNRITPEPPLNIFPLSRTIRHPGHESIQSLADALRQLRRVGNADVTSVTVKTEAQCAPWTLAFVKWSLGYPPTVMLSDGTPIIEQAGSDVTVIMEEDACSVIMHSSIHGPSKLVESRPTSEPLSIVSGMVSLQSYGSLLQRRYGFETGLASAAFQEAIPYALRRVMRQISFADRAYAASDKAKVPTSVRKAHRQMSISPFPHDWVISNICRLLFGQNSDFQTLKDDKPIADLPLMALYIADCRKVCRCSVCRKTDPRKQNATCNARATLSFVHAVVSDILALSLFERPESLQVSTAALLHDRMGANHGFRRSISAILNDNKPSACTLQSLLDRALQLAGHESINQRNEATPLIMSSYRGQTVWASLYESLTYEKRGFLCLSWLPGVLKHKGDVYKQALGVRSPLLLDVSCTEEEPENLLRPCNLYPRIQTTWKVSTYEDGIHVGLGVWLGGMRSVPSNTVCPFDVLLNIARSLFVEDCMHDPDSSLEDSNHLSEVIGISEGYTKVNGSKSPPVDEQPGRPTIGVVPVDGHQGLRFITIGNRLRISPVVLRQKACLACCLDACRKAEVHTLVL